MSLSNWETIWRNRGTLPDTRKRRAMFRVAVSLAALLVSLPVEAKL
jgi:hypothetical protein